MTMPAPQQPKTPSAPSDANPFAPPADWPRAVAGARRRVGRVALVMFVAILLGDLSLSLGVSFFAIASFSARFVLVLFGTGGALVATLQAGLGRSDSAREWFIMALIFCGVAVASVPQLFLLGGPVLR